MSVRLRVLAYTDSGEVGGAELALGYLLGALRENIDVGVLATDARVAAAIAAHRPGAAAIAVRAPSGAADAAALFEHARAIRSFSPHILHANQAWPWACGYGELAALLLGGVRVLAVDHLPVGGALPRLRVHGRRLLARRLDAHVSVGEHAAREVEELLGLPRGAVGAVPNGVPRAALLKAPAERSAPTHGPVVGSLGRLTEQKGYDLLVRALPDLPGARLVLVGDGPAREQLEALARELGVADRLAITGWCADARSRLPELDVFALPSRWEGMPLGILEAMHAGLPVLASDVGSVAEAVGDGETGFLVKRDDVAEIRDRLRRLLADPPLRAQMGRRGRELALARFTDDAMARRYEAIYQALADRGRRESYHRRAQPSTPRGRGQFK